MKSRSTYKNMSPCSAILQSRGCSLEPSDFVDVQENVVRLPGYALRIMTAERLATLT